MIVCCCKLFVDYTFMGFEKQSVWGRKSVLYGMNMKGEPPPNVREVGRVAKK